MRMGAGLAVICAGAILAFAVTTNTSVFNLHTAGWVLIIVGVIGIVLPRRTYGWLGTRMIRRTRVFPNDRPYYVAYGGTTRVRAGLPARPTGYDRAEATDTLKDTEVIEEDIYEA